MIAPERLASRCPCGRDLPIERAWLGDAPCACGRRWLSVGFGFVPYLDDFAFVWGARYPRALHRAMELHGGRFLPAEDVDAFAKVLDPDVAPDHVRTRAVGHFLGALSKLPRPKASELVVAVAMEVAIERVLDRLRRVRQAAPAGLARVLFADVTSGAPEALRRIDAALVEAAAELAHRRQVLRLRRASAEVRALEVAEEHQARRALAEVAIEFCVVDGDLLDRLLLDHVALACGGDRRTTHDRLAAIAARGEWIPRWRAFDHGMTASDADLVLPLLKLIARQLERDGDAARAIDDYDAERFDAYRDRLLEVAAVSVASRREALATLLVELVHTDDDEAALTRSTTLERLVDEAKITRAVGVDGPLVREVAARFHRASGAS